MNLSPQQMEKLEELCTEICVQKGCVLYDFEWVGKGGTRTLRVFIDQPGVGVTVDQCAQVSQSLSLLLDVEDLVDGGMYDLEVSSPGLERSLKKKWHFQNAIGKKIKVNTNDVIPWPEQYSEVLLSKKPKGKKIIEGILKEVHEGFITLESQNYDWKIPNQIIHKSNIIFEMKVNK